MYVSEISVSCGISDVSSDLYISEISVSCGISDVVCDISAVSVIYEVSFSVLSSALFSSLLLLLALSDFSSFLSVPELSSYFVTSVITGI